MIASVKKICPKLYPIDGDMSKQWFIKFQIPTHNGQSKKSVKIYIPKLASSVARLEAANKIIADIRKNGYEVGAKKQKVGFSISEVPFRISATNGTPQYIQKNN